MPSRRQPESRSGLLGDNVLPADSMRLTRGERSVPAACNAQPVEMQWTAGSGVTPATASVWRSDLRIYPLRLLGQGPTEKTTGLDAFLTEP